MSTRLNIPVRVVEAYLAELQDSGHCVEQTYSGLVLLSKIPHEEVKTVVKDWKGDKVIRFGMTGDTHIGSKFCQIGLLHRAYEIFKAEGIADVYHTGDLTEGENMRQGHAYECYVHGADEYIAEVCKNYPSVEGITTNVAYGNHDASFIKHVGLDIGKPIAQLRPDLKYLGQGQAYVKLTPNCVLELRHPGGGSAYALSYKPQKIIESMFGGTKPNILALGHFHKSEYMFYRNVHMFQTGTLQAQSGFMRDHGLVACVGFWIVTVHVGDDGEVRRIIPEFFPFYETIPDDYKNWR
jgi:predicted phosphodiesterase